MIRPLLIVLFTLLMTSPAHANTPSKDTLRVLVWNVLHGGNDVEQGPEKALALIRETKPDIVLLQESYDIDGERPKLGAWLASQLGWSQWQGRSAHLAVLTPLEITATFLHHPWHGVGAQLTDSQGRTFYAWSSWVDYRSDLTEDLRDDPNISDEELLAAEDVRSSRLPQTQALIAEIDALGHTTAQVPVLVGGDWNTPSHLDWTRDTARIYKHRRALPLPVSTAMQEAGYADTFRVVYPSPVQHPGLTWSPLWRKNEGRAPCFERIDRLYLKNPTQPIGGWVLQPVAAKVLPEVWENENIPVAKRNFPSDHGALLVSLEWILIGD